MINIERYNHHDRDVAVQSHLKGRHREHCLCYHCARFKPYDRIMNCSIANQLYKFCVTHGVTTPMWECPMFKQKVEE